MFASLALVAALLAQDASPPATPPPPTSSSDAPADADAPTESVTVEAPRVDPLDVVHRRREPRGVGSILPRRICSSERQDRERREHDQSEFGRMQDIQGRGQPVRRGLD